MAELDLNTTFSLSGHDSLVATDLIKGALALRLPVALWRMPGSAESFLLIQQNEALQFEHQLNNATRGFALSPFVPDTRGLAILQPDFLLKLSASGVEVLTADIDFVAELKAAAKPVVDKDFTGLLHSSVANLGSASSQNNYCKLVSEAVEAINQGAMEKVVLSKMKQKELPGNFDPLALWLSLTEKYPSAFVSFVSVPEYGTWLGATPELLMEVREKRYFRTVALAGTKPACETAEKEIAWSQKEIEEQALVSRYIINCFKTIRLRDFEEKGPRTITAGHLHHLQTTFTADMQATGFPDLPKQMLELLHPTSAVGGMPRKEAIQFILDNESHNRQLYSGFLGPVDIENKTALFVNLRCLQLLQGKAIFYSGAGITQDSVPEKEWTETELKADILGKVLEGM